MSTPDRKVTAATLASAAVTLVTVILVACHVDVPAAAAAPAATLAAFLFGYLVKSKRPAARGTSNPVGAPNRKKRGKS